MARCRGPGVRGWGFLIPSERAIIAFGHVLTVVYHFLTLQLTLRKGHTAAIMTGIVIPAAETIDT